MLKHFLLYSRRILSQLRSRVNFEKIKSVIYWLKYIVLISSMEKLSRNSFGIER
jgi:hypothetical protein